MSVDTYKGDTHAKRLARLHFWMRIRDYFGDTFRSRRFAYLASSAGGDASVLDGLGVPADQQLAIDIDAVALSRFHDRHPRVPIALGDAGQILGGWAGRKFDVVFLDLCCNPSPRCASLLKRASRATRHGSIFAYAFQRGREAPGLMAAFKTAMDAAEPSRAKVAAAFGERPRVGYDQKNGRPLTPKELAKIQSRAEDGRGMWLYNHLFDDCGTRACVPLTLCSLFYQSTTAWSAGTPMAIMAKWMFYVTQGPFAEERDRAVKRNIGRLVEEDRAAVAIKLHGADSYFANIVRHHRDVDAMPVGSGWDNNGDYSMVGVEDSVATASMLDGIGLDAARLLNVSKGTLAAWRAHATRGTYDKGEAAE